MHLHIVSYQFPPSTAEVFENLGATILSKDMIRLAHWLKKNSVSFVLCIPFTQGYLFQG